MPKIKFDVDNYRRYLENLVKRTGEEYDLEFVAGVTADVDWLWSSVSHAADCP